MEPSPEKDLRMKEKIQRRTEEDKTEIHKVSHQFVQFLSHLSSSSNLSHEQQAKEDSEMVEGPGVI